MDSLIAKANAIQPLEKKRRRPPNTTSGKQKKPSISTEKPDKTALSITSNVQLPKSMRNLTKTAEKVPTHSHIPNKKLRTQLTRTALHNAQSKALLKDAEMFLTEEAGVMEVEGEMEKTWRVTQDEIVNAAGQEAAKGRKELKLDGGPYRSRYTRNGRHLAIVGNSGHVATFDWQTGVLHAELQLQETCRDITFLHDHSHFAVAQKKYVFIYDRDGVELHRLKSHIEPTRLEYLPYHWLLASIGNPGYLKYQDTSTGQIVVEHRTKLGSCNAMTQNLHNAVIHLGHQNGRVTLWTPNLSHPAVQLLAHLGPVVSVSVDPSQGGRYMATAGQDGTVKIWDCRNWKGSVREWPSRGGSAVVEWSARGSLAVASGGTVNVYNSPTIHEHFIPKIAPPLYITHPVPHQPITSLRFAPYQDVLTISHSSGISSILVPGSGEPNFDSSEADPFENKKARREREVKSLLDKIQPDMIALDPEFVGSLVPPSKLTTTTSNGKPAIEVPFSRLPRLQRLQVQGKADETEVVDDVENDDDDEINSDGKRKDMAEREKRKKRGKGKSLKRYLRKQRKNVIDPTVVAIRAKLAKQKAEKQRAKAVEASAGDDETRRPSALDRFKRKV